MRSLSHFTASEFPEKYLTADQEIPSCEPPVNTTLPNWRQRLRDEALHLYQKESEEPASKVVAVAEEDQARCGL